MTPKLGDTVQLANGQTGSVSGSWAAYYKPVIGGVMDFEFVQKDRIWVRTPDGFVTVDAESVSVI